MTLHRALVAAGSLLVVAVLVRCLPTVEGEQTDWDVRGNYDLTYDDKLILKLDVGGAVREATASGYGQVVDFGTWDGHPLTLDLAAFCARPEVVCPSETLWKKVAVDQRDVTTAQNVYVIQVVDNEKRDLPEGEKAQALGGLLAYNNEDRFVVGLGASGGSSENCRALGISLAAGRFTHEKEKLEWYTQFRTPSGARCDPYDAGVLHPDAGDAGGVDAGSPDAGSLDDGGLDGALPDAGPADAGECQAYEFSRHDYPKGAAVNGIADGRIFIGYVGGCAFGPVLAAATLTIETGFTGKRTGAFDPPPFTPVEPVEVDSGDGGVASSRDGSGPPPMRPDAASVEPLDASLAAADASAGGPDASVAELSDAGSRD